MKLTARLVALFLSFAAHIPDAAPSPLSPSCGARVVRVDVPNADVVVFESPAVVWITER